LRQVMWNLLANAVKFTPPKGHVQVTLRRSGTDARVVVADTGQGIPASFLPHVFERFRQVDTTSTRRHGGLGIGLAIVHELVELHGGSVSADSPGEGRGATFTVELPVATLVYAPEATRAVRPSGSALAGVRLLVVDDDADSNEVVRMLLTSCGAEVRTASSARAIFTSPTRSIIACRNWHPTEHSSLSGKGPSQDFMVHAASPLVLMTRFTLSIRATTESLSSAQTAGCWQSGAAPEMAMHSSMTPLPLRLIPPPIRSMSPIRVTSGYRYLTTTEDF